MCKHEDERENMESGVVDSGLQAVGEVIYKSD